MNKLAILLIFTGVCHADMIKFNTYSIPVPVITSRHVDVTGTLNIPQFDPSLGVLDSIQFQFGALGGMTLDTISREHASSYTDYDVHTSFSFLGLNASFRERSMGSGWSGSYPSCGTTYVPMPPLPSPPTNFTLTCPDSFVPLTDGGLGVVGTIWNSGFTAYTDRYFSSVSGTLPGLDYFTGTGLLGLPMSISVDLFEPFSHGVVFGDLTGANVGGGALLTYNYTPVPIVETVTATPEPGTFALGVVALLGIWWKKRKKNAKG